MQTTTAQTHALHSSPQVLLHIWPCSPASISCLLKSLHIALSGHPLLASAFSSICSMSSRDRASAVQDLQLDAGCERPGVATGSTSPFVLDRTSCAMVQMAHLIWRTRCLRALGSELLELVANHTSVQCCHLGHRIL